MMGFFARALCCLALPALAGCVSAAVEGANMARDEVVYDDYIAAAEAGDAEAQYRLALVLRSGRTEAPDGPEQAVAWLRKAAEQGHAKAKEALGQ